MGVAFFFTYREGNGNATEVAGCELRVAYKTPPSTCHKSDFIEKRNPQPSGVYLFFLLYWCNLMGMFFFFIFILYIIYIHTLVSHKNLGLVKH